MENKKGSSIFLGVIGVATLVVAIIGATFAYFSASTNSDTDAISVNSTTLELGFDDSINKKLSTTMIPAKEGIASYGAMNQAYITNADEEQCIDDNGNSICSIYEFTISNPSENAAQSITVSLNVVTNGFDNLKYKIYEGTTKLGERTGITVLDYKTTAAGAEDASNPTPVIAATTFLGDGKSTRLTELEGVLDPLETHTYTMLIWIDETGEDQTSADAEAGTKGDAGKGFSAGLVITSGNGAGVTGVIGASGIETTKTEG